VRCAIEEQNGMVERSAGLPPERPIECRVGIHLGDVVEERDGDLMGATAFNIATPLEASPSRAGSVSRKTLTGKSRSGLISRLPISTQPNSRTSPSRSGLLASSWRSRPVEGRFTPVLGRKISAASPLDRGAPIRQYRRRSNTGLFR